MRKECFSFHKPATKQVSMLGRCFRGKTFQICDKRSRGCPLVCSDVRSNLADVARLVRLGEEPVKRRAFDSWDCNSNMA